MDSACASSIWQLRSVQPQPTSLVSWSSPAGTPLLVSVHALGHSELSGMSSPELLWTHTRNWQAVQGLRGIQI
jgi:hypothetical protein